ncbi:MAG: NAD-dependent epimerase/dehydratase family protein [Candidatus Omnitrophota bacterium]|jgi:nucleoside-diphosphate-sugar epimerase
MKKPIVAILGASSHIAKGLINNFLEEKGSSLHLFTRSPGKVRSFLGALGKAGRRDCLIHSGYSGFKKYPYDAIINCVGVGTLNKLKGDYTKYFTVTEEYDNLVINYLRNSYPGALYISFSSGVVYGRECAAPAQENTLNGIRVNHILPGDYYAIARLNAEAKHRSLKDLKIIDLRLFSYFSRFIDLTDGYFISEIINCILHNKALLTDNVNIIRDYVHPKDLFSIVRKCMATGKMNKAFDVTSSRPAGKKEILEFFSLKYGLAHKIGRSLSHLSATGQKNIYYSRYRNAASIGYKPVFSSMDTIKEEAKYILGSEKV